MQQQDRFAVPQMYRLATRHLADSKVIPPVPQGVLMAGRKIVKAGSEWRYKGVELSRLGVCGSPYARGYL
jgi:hypothetical protein